MVRRALVLKGGTIRGAFLVGVMKTVHRLLGSDYFDTIFATSVGVFEQAFFASGQIYTMEKTWRDYVHGNQLINWANPLRGKPILDLDYLIGIFQSEKSFLDVEKMKKSQANLFTFITDYETRIPEIIDLKQGFVFDIMRATCAIPIVYSKKVIINDKRYVDSRLAHKETFRKFINDSLVGFDEVFVITSNPKDTDFDTKFKVIKPSNIFLWGPMDTNRERIIKTIEQGEIDAENFINKHLL